jgi:hypothetical protein
MSKNAEPGFVRDRRTVVATLASLLGLTGLASGKFVGMQDTTFGASPLACMLATLQLDERGVASLCTARARSQLALHVSRCGEQIARLQKRADVASSKRFLREQIEGDYSRGAIVDIDGWQLASTEALIIALVAHAARSNRAARDTDCLVALRGA